MDRQQRIEAGEWLKRERERRDVSVRKLATALGVATQAIYDWQSGRNAVSDDRAQQIAAVLNMDTVDVRRGLGLWVPEDNRSEPEPEPEDESIEDRIQRLITLGEEALAEIRRQRNEDEQRDVG